MVSLRTSVLALSLGMVLALCGIAIAGNGGDTYTGCLTNGGSINNVAAGDEPAKPCTGNSVEITWGETGPRGPAGPVGPVGPQGPEATPTVFSLLVEITGDAPSGTPFVLGPDIECQAGDDLADCAEVYAKGTAVRLRPSVPNPDDFVGWSGDCDGQGECSITMDANKLVVAEFSDTCVDDQYEPNNTPVDHHYLGVVEDGQALGPIDAVRCFGDTDWYRFMTIETGGQACPPPPFPGTPVTEDYRTTVDISTGLGFDALRFELRAEPGLTPRDTITVGPGQSGTLEWRWQGTCGTDDTTPFFIAVSGAGENTYQFTVAYEEG